MSSSFPPSDSPPPKRGRIIQEENSTNAIDVLNTFNSNDQEPHLHRSSSKKSCIKNVGSIATSRTKDEEELESSNNEEKENKRKERKKSPSGINAEYKSSNFVEPSKPNIRNDKKRSKSRTNLRLSTTEKDRSDSNEADEPSRLENDTPGRFLQGAGDAKVQNKITKESTMVTETPTASDPPKKLYIAIRVGGKKYNLLKKTVRREPNCILAKLSNGASPAEISVDEDEEGVYCFDESPNFPVLLTFLKTGKITEDENVKLTDILAQAEYFGMDGMVQRLQHMITERQMQMLDKTRKACSESRSLFPNRNVITDDDNTANMRRRFYVTWSNDSNYPQLFRNTYKDVRLFFSTNYFEFDEFLPNEDILETILKNGDNRSLNKSIKDDAKEAEINVNVKDFPVSVTIPISELILARVDRTIATSKVRKLGYQHIFVSNYVVDSGANVSSAESSNSESEGFSSSAHSSDLDTSLKTCPIAKNVDYESLLVPHEDNSTRISPTSHGVRVDVLILVLDKDICKNLAKFLGLIFLEEVVTQAKMKRGPNIAHSRAKNKHAKLYTMIQNHLSKKLVFGKNNIVVTANCNYFKWIKADVKATILSQGRCAELQFEELVSIEITLKNEKSNNILEYVQGVTEIINAIVNVKVDIETVFFSRKEKKFYKTRCPLFSVIPLFVLKKCSQLLHRDPTYIDCFSFDMI